MYLFFLLLLLRHLGFNIFPVSLLGVGQADDGHEHVDEVEGTNEDDHGEEYDIPRSRSQQGLHTTDQASGALPDS